jgi:hypothetical protein
MIVRTSAIATVAAALSLLMMASATAQMRGLRGGPFPFGPTFVPRDEPPTETLVRRPRDEPPVERIVRGQREPQPENMQGRSQRIESQPRIETSPVAQARTPQATTVSPIQLNMDAIPSLTPDGVRKVQQLLKEKGLNPGPIDGVAGPLTNAAVKAFQESYGIKANGGIDNQTLFALGATDLAGEAN